MDKRVLPVKISWVEICNAQIPAREPHKKKKIGHTDFNIHFDVKIH